jgi:drug/metabolite transporter (DMT)-like permease
MWLGLALLTALLTSFNPILYKQILVEAEAAEAVWGVTLLSLPLLAATSALWVIPFPHVDAWFWAGILGSALLNILAQLSSTQALQLADASFVTPLLTFNPVFTLFISALTLHEIPTPLGVAGVALIGLGTYLLNLKEKAGWLTPLRELIANRAVALALLAALIWGLTPILEKVAIEHTAPQNPPLVALGTTLPQVVFLSLPVLRRTAHVRVAVARQWRAFLLAGLISGVAPVLGFTAIALGLVAYVTAIFKLGTLLTVVWGAVILREGNWRQRLPASALMVLGALLIAS